MDLSKIAMQEKTFWAKKYAEYKNLSKALC